MPKTRRWYAVAQDMLNDAEFIEAHNRYGKVAILFWLHTLSTLDRNDNKWCLHTQWSLQSLAKHLGTLRATLLKVYQYCKDKGWIQVGITKEGLQFLYAPNWLKYNISREQHQDVTIWLSRFKGTPSPTLPNPTKKETPLTPLSGGTAEDSQAPPSLPPTNGIPPKKKGSWRKEPKVAMVLTCRPEDFNQLWSNYPNGSGKQRAIEAWEKLQPGDEVLGEIRSALKWQRELERWTKDKGEFVPMLSTYLNEQRWTDKPPTERREQRRVAL